MAAPAPPPPAASSPSGADDRTPADGRDDPVVLAGRYRLDRRIGQGGMAEVWVAVDEQLDRRVALKWLRPSLASDPVIAERFRREAIAVARLNHPNIVAVHDVFVHDGRQAVVMQLVDGKSLRQLLDSQKRLGPELTIHIGAAVAGALDEAHRAGFVHRDVKPGNILVTSDGRVLLTDFGIAKSVDEDDLTSDNVMMGTAKYLSPEQVRGRKLDGRADLYSLGLVLYECLAGRVPFQGESDADTALARLQRDPTDLNRLRPTLPRGLVDLIHRTLSRNPAHRPATGHEMRTSLLAVDTTPPVIEGTPADPIRRVPLLRNATPPGPARPAIPGEPAPGMNDAPAAPLPRRSVHDDDVHDRGGPSDHGAGARRDPSPSAAPRSAFVDPTPVDGTPTPVRDDPDRTGVVGRSDPARRRTPTPPSGRPVHGAPARGLQQSPRTSLIVIGVLLVLAAAVVGVIWLTMGLGESTDDPIGDAGDAAPVTTTAPPVTEAPDSSGPASIATVGTFDPDGDGSGENDELAGLALAGASPAGGWPTLCYSSQWMGAKTGVGLIVTLTEASGGTLGVDALHAPYWVEVFATSATDAPGTLDGWGASLTGTETGTSPARIEADLPDGTTHALVWIRELGPDEACSSTNPFRGRLGGVTFSP